MKVNGSLFLLFFLLQLSWGVAQVSDAARASVGQWSIKSVELTNQRTRRACPADLLGPLSICTAASTDLIHHPVGLRLPPDTAGVFANRFSLPPLPLLPAGGYSGNSARPSLPAPPEMPAAWAYEKLGAFCKWEAKLEKAARMPVKFRLGEVQYVERMEGKLPDY